MDQSKDWNKIYSILPTQTTVRFTSDAQQLFSSGELNFTAQTEKISNKIKLIRIFITKVSSFGLRI